MAGINDYSNTAGSNTTINGIDIAEGCSPAGINNAIRQLMADIADMDDGVVPLQTPDINGGTIDGAVIGGTTPAAATFTSITTTGDINFGDNDKAVFGAGSDLQIYHSGTNSFITDQGTGDLFIRGGADIKLQTPTGENGIIVNQDLSVDLYHNNSKKLATTSGGIDVTGTVVSDGLTVDGNATFEGSYVHIESTQPKLRFLESDTTDENFEIRLNAGSARFLTRSDDLSTIDRERMRIDNSTGDISFYEDTGTTPKFFWDASAEALGIGTSSPSKRLQSVVSSSGSLETALALQNSNAVDGTETALDFSSNTSFVATARISSARDGAGLHSLRFSTYNLGLSEAMRIDSSGRVGIGTSSPSANLDIRFSSTNTSPTPNNSNLRVLQTTGGANGYFASINLGTSTVGDGADSMIVSYGITNGQSALAFFTDNLNTCSERMRIDQNGNVGIGTSSPQSELHVNSSANADIRLTNDTVGTSASDGLTITMATTSVASINQRENAPLLFYTNNTERMRIDSSGHVLFGKTSTSSGVVGVRIITSGSATGLTEITRSDGQPLNVNRETNDGTLVGFYQDDALEGSISVSGSTVSYNGFTGTHWSRLSDNSKPTILKGTILQSLDEMMDWYQVQFDITETDDEGNETTRTEKQSYALGDGESVGDVITYNFEGTDYQATIIQEGDVKHTKSKISDTVDAKNVYGVFMAWDNDDDTVNDMYVAQTGTFVVRINGSETVSKGDLIQSNGDGTGKVQADDLLRASTVAKVLSTTKIETYDDGSYIVPCSLHC